MHSRTWASIVAGLFAGVVFGSLMQFMMAPTPDGGRMPMMAMVGMVVGPPMVVAGWLYHLFNSAVIGAIFGWLFGRRVHDFRSAVTGGLVYGFAWWILGALILMPMMLGMRPFAPLIMLPMQMMAMGSLIGHLVFGLVLGACYAWLYSPSVVRA